MHILTVHFILIALIIGLVAVAFPSPTIYSRNLTVLDSYLLFRLLTNCEKNEQIKLRGLKNHMFLLTQHISILPTCAVAVRPTCKWLLFKMFSFDNVKECYKLNQTNSHVHTILQR